jgi:choline dehydrogenase-like flavoprotein
MSNDHYDLIVIGSGPGGASLAQRLATTGKRILLLERGDYLPRTRANWDAQTVFGDNAYQAPETWYDGAAKPFHPGLHYYVGGNSKVYGAALLRLRERDFGELRHHDGLSPAWPVRYDTFEPYYGEAERLFHVHGLRGEDPSEPHASGPFPYPPVSHEPAIASLHAGLEASGLRPFHLPLGILLDERDGKPTPTSTCIRCDTFDGFPCPLNGKADAQVMCVDPALAAHPNLTLLTNAYVTELQTDPAGKRVTGVLVERNAKRDGQSDAQRGGQSDGQRGGQSDGQRGGQRERYTADIVVVACGALSSALLLLRSGNAAHPAGLANGSGQVGRNYLRHNQSVLMALTRAPNTTVFQKTLALSDWYFGCDDWNYPLGLVQMCASMHGAQVRGEVLPGWLEWLPDMPFEQVARHSMCFWLSSEDLPRAENRVYYDGDRVVLEFEDNNLEAHRRLRGKLEQTLRKSGTEPLLHERGLFLTQTIPLAGTAHQAGTLRFGTDPASSVLDPDCKAHELDNLYVTDGSFFPSIGAVNPTLTIIANALRVADKIKERLK